MDLLLMSVVGIIISFILIHFGAKSTLNGALRLSSTLCLEKAVVGTVFVASITVLPELMSSLIAVTQGSSDLALGNILGSNIYNVPLLIGICGLIREFEVKSSTLTDAGAFLIGLSALLAALLITNGGLAIWIGMVFLAFYPIFIYRSLGKSNIYDGGGNMKPAKYSARRSALYIVLGGLALLSGTLLLVNSALEIMDIFGLREFYVGVTIVAMGSVIPEVAVSFFAASKGEQDVSMGNVLGDNILTITLVFGLVSIICPFKVTILEVLATIPFTILLTFMLVVMGRKHQKITKPISLLMLAIAVISLGTQTLLLRA